MGLSRKHFEAIAELLNKELKRNGELLKMAEEENDEDAQTQYASQCIEVERIEALLSNYFATENSSFDANKFKEAILKE